MLKFALFLQSKSCPRSRLSSPQLKTRPFKTGRQPRHSVTKRGIVLLSVFFFCNFLTAEYKQTNHLMENPHVCTCKLPIPREEKQFSQAEINELNQKRQKEICKFFRGGQGCIKKTCLFQHPCRRCKHYSRPQNCKFGTKMSFHAFQRRSSSTSRYSGQNQ